MAARPTAQGGHADFCETATMVMAGLCLLRSSSVASRRLRVEITRCPAPQRNHLPVGAQATGCGSQRSRMGHRRHSHMALCLDACFPSLWSCQADRQAVESQVHAAPGPDNLFAAQVSFSQQGLPRYSRTSGGADAAGVREPPRSPWVASETDPGTPAGPAQAEELPAELQGWPPRVSSTIHG